MQEEDEVIVDASGRGYWVYTCNERPQGRFQVDGRQKKVCTVSRGRLCLMYVMFFFFSVSRTRHHSCAGHCFTIRSHCNFFRNATIPPGRIKQQRETKQTATKQDQQRNTNQTQTENQTPEWKLSSLFLYNVQRK